MNDYMELALFETGLGIKIGVICLLLSIIFGLALALYERKVTYSEAFVFIPLASLAVLCFAVSIALLPTSIYRRYVWEHYPTQAYMLEYHRDIDVHIKGE